MATNTVSIAAISSDPNYPSVDNELYVVAIATDGHISYQLAHVQSGSYNATNVAINISAGTYSEPALVNSLSSAVTTSYSVQIPAGTYVVLGVGVNWGGPWSFSYKVNNNTPQAGSNQNQSNGALGAVWQSNSNDQITV